MKRMIVLMSLLTLLSAIMSSCEKTKSEKTASDLSFDICKRINHIYILEDGEYVPFYVLTNDYDGNTLLLRKNVLSKPQRINDYSSLYENSEIDVFLNTEYAEKLSNIQSLISETNIEVTAETAIGVSGTETTVIKRKVFLLSCNEVDISALSKEGKSLSFFNEPSNRIAYDGEALSSWWLRTPDTWRESCTFVVGENNKLGSTNAYDINGIRPAFCIPSFTKIEEKSDVVQNKKVYVIKNHLGEDV